jgi:uncharacterized protein (DUF58 family)
VTRGPGRAGLRVLRVASLLFPSAVAWEVASLALQRTRLDEAIAWALGPLWIATLGALVVRSIDVYVGVRVRGRATDHRSRVSWVDTLEVLTASGAALAWSGAAAVVAAAWLGWASLSIVGLFGLCALHLVALWTLLRASGHDPWRRDSLTRRFVPAAAVEGETVTEEVRWEAPRIPAGFRLLASGRLGPRWPMTRYAVEADDSAGEVVIESDVGPARRGVHDAEPLDVWLQDVLGLCRSPRVAAGAARLTVRPKAAKMEGAAPLPARGGADEEPRPAARLPTEGSFRLREYQPGDDTRRIHWLRSLAAQDLIVRLPDEVPVDRPGVRLVLDTFHPLLVRHGRTLTCDSPAELLDALVQIWLGIGCALSDRGVRITAVAVVGDERLREPAAHSAVLRERRTRTEVQGLGARAQWQAAIAPASLLSSARGATLVVSHRLPVDDAERAARWVVAPGALWAAAPTPPAGLGFLLPYPLGSAENRSSRRRAERARYRRARVDHDVFRMLCEHPRLHTAGHLLARRGRAGEAILEVLS